MFDLILNGNGAITDIILCVCVCVACARARVYCVRYNVPIAELARKERKRIVKRGTTFDGGPGVLIFTRSTTGARF